MSGSSLPLFPLHTVLFPGARLQLRIFEPRYVDLVAACGRDGSGFGVCLIVEGGEIGEAPRHAVVGTQARIVDFTSLPDGLLGITVQGDRRFRVERARVRADGLIVADGVSWLAPETPTPLPIEYDLLATLLRRLIERMGGVHAAADEAAYADAAWVGWRLAELLPLARTDRQSLLEESDPAARLRRLLDLVAQLQAE
ncbi:MAG TPA: LON peptidase substrate-binding domain-containing protein [Xanthomonadaceae bacterium]